MGSPGRVSWAAIRALPPAMVVGAGTLLFGAIDMVRRDTRPAVWGVIGLGLAAVAFSRYFILGLASYRVSRDGSVRVPWPYVWLVVLIVVLAVGAAASIVLRTDPSRGGNVAPNHPLERTAGSHSLASAAQWDRWTA